MLVAFLDVKAENDSLWLNRVGPGYARETFRLFLKITPARGLEGRCDVCSYGAWGSL